MDPAARWPITRVTKLFLSNRSQTLRIPAHLRLPDTVTEVELRACGHERIISPPCRRWETFSAIARPFPITSWRCGPPRSKPSEKRSDNRHVVLSAGYKYLYLRDQG